MERRETLSIPRGWFAVAHSDEISVGEVQKVHYFGEDLVIFRTESGEAGVFEAFCPHLGAHLGVGGKVDGETLRCPFHGWGFATSGECVDIPYAKRIPPGVRAGGLQALERNGFIFVWWDPDGSEAWYDVPEVPEALSDDWSSPDRYEWKVSAHSQELAENGVDQAHFQFVHGTLAVPASESTEEGPTRRTFAPIEMKTPRGDVNGGIETHMYGMGFATVRFTGIAETLEFTSTTPIDEGRAHVRYNFIQPKVDGKDPEGGVAAALIRDIVKQMNEDVPIWENKKYLPRPTLCDGDGPIADFRRWCEQFYPDSAG